MAFDITVHRDLKKLRRGLNTFEKKVAPQATVRTLNRVGENAKSASARHIAPQMGSRQAGVKRRIATRKSTMRRLWVILVASDRPLHLIEFVVGSKKPTQQPGGKRGPVKAKAWGKTKTYHGAFIAPRKKGSSKTTVYVRKSGKRLPLKALFGPGIMQLFKQQREYECDGKHSAGSSTEGVYAKPCLLCLADQALILIGEHDGQYTGGDFRISRIFRTILHIGIVIVDLPEEILTINNDFTEIMFTIWIILLGESIEVAHGGEDPHLRILP